MDTKQLSLKLILTACVVILIFALFQHHIKLSHNFKIDTDNLAEDKSIYFSETTLITHQAYNHASSLVALDQNHALLSWVGGKKELDPNINVYLSNITLNDHLSDTPFHAILNKFSVEQDEHRYMHSLGNPLLVQYDHKLWLFFVSTFGGWATASINYETSSDKGVTWTPARVLKLSPFLNFSHSLKGPPVFFEDGTLGLPIYHELLKSKAKLLRINSKGEILSLEGLSNNGHSLQPIVVPMSEKTAFVFMRQKGSPLKKIFLNKSSDGGFSWNNFSSSILNNPDAAVAAVKMNQDAILVAFNNSETDRKNLSFAILNPSKKEICILPFKKYSEGNNNFLAYPYLIKVQNHYLMSYTDSGNIAVVEFNSAWLEAQWKHCT